LGLGSAVSGGRDGLSSRQGGWGQRGVEEERKKNERQKRRAVAWGLGRRRVEEERKKNKGERVRLN